MYFILSGNCVGVIGEWGSGSGSMRICGWEAERGFGFGGLKFNPPENRLASALRASQSIQRKMLWKSGKIFRAGTQGMAREYTPRAVIAGSLPII